MEAWTTLNVQTVTLIEKERSPDIVYVAEQRGWFRKIPAHFKEIGLFGFRGVVWTREELLAKGRYGRKVEIDDKNTVWYLMNRIVIYYENGEKKVMEFNSFSEAESWYDANIHKLLPSRI